MALGGPLSTSAAGRTQGPEGELPDRRVAGAWLALQILGWQVFGCLLATQADFELKRVGLSARAMVLNSRRRDCLFAGITPSSSLLKRLLKREGVQQNDSLADG